MTTTKAQKKTGVHFDRITEVIDATVDNRYACVEQNSFLKLVAPGGHVLYFALGKPNCRRVDLSFVPPEELGLSSVIPIRAPNGRIKRELDTDHPAFLDDLALLLAWLAEAPPVEKERRTAFVPRLPVVAARPSGDSPAPRGRSRADLIREVARQHGVSVSPGVLDEEPAGAPPAPPTLDETVVLDDARWDRIAEMGPLGD